jgi:CrcB protein
LGLYLNKRSILIDCCCHIYDTFSQVDQGKDMSEVLIALGAALGAPARFLIDNQFRKFTDKPVGIFLVNVLGSFLIGLTVGTGSDWHDFLAIGFLGAFTTWSTFMLDIYLAYKLKKYRDAAINLSASLFFGLLAAWVGLHLAQ